MTMTLEEAQKIMGSVVLKRARWGKQYSMSTDSEWSGDKIMEAIGIVWTELKEGTEEIKAQLTKANRQLGASKAREEKLKKRVEKLKADLQRAKRPPLETPNSLV